MSSLQGLPPLPRSLSGFNLSGGRSEGCEPPPPPTRSSSKTQRGGKTPIQSSSRPSPPARQLTTLDTQLAILRREMFGLRQLDLSLLAQLWSLNESIQEFRQLLQEQEDRAPSLPLAVKKGMTPLMELILHHLREDQLLVYIYTDRLGHPDRLGHLLMTNRHLARNTELFDAYSYRLFAF